MRPAHEQRSQPRNKTGSNFCFYAGSASTLTPNTTDLMDVSIVIVNWNTKDILRDCVKSIYEQTHEIQYEIIVVDNGSSDGSAKMLKATFPQVKLIENSWNKGFAAANNQGMKTAAGRYILLLNSDTIICNGAIQKSILYADAHHDVGVLGCRVLWPDGRHQFSCFRFPSLPNITLAAIMVVRQLPGINFAFLHSERYRYHDFNRELDVDIVAACFLLVRHEVLDQVGLMDEDYFMYGEEVDWCYRIRRGGWIVRYFPGAKIIHLFGASSAKALEETKINKRRGQLLFLHKAYGMRYAWLANAIMVIGVVLRIPLWLIADILNAFRRRDWLASLAHS